MQASSTTNSDTPKPDCLITAIPGIGERRSYRHLSQPFVAHAHSYYVIGLVKEGRRTLQCNGQSFELQPDDLVVFNPGDIHSCEQCDGNLFSYECIALEPSALQGILLQGPRVQNSIVRQVFQETLAAIDTQTTPQIFHHILHLSTLLLHPDTPSSPSTLHEAAAMHVRDHFADHLSQPESLDTLADQEGLSPYSLIRAYHRRFSITPKKHLASLRVEWASELLSQGVAPSAVATAVGFADQPHFTRAFKQRLGVTPAAYQRMISPTKPTP